MSNINKVPDQVPPDEHQIEELLRHFHPQPGARFTERMMKTPWKVVNKTPTFLHSNRTPRLAWALILLLVVVLTASSLFLPPVRAIARQIIFSFFTSSSNQIQVTATLSSPGDLFDFADPAHFSLTLDQAQQLAGFTVKQIPPPLQDLSLIGAQFDSTFNTVVLLYQADQYKLFLTQRPLKNSRDIFSIGSDAMVELVKIRGVQGEYVHGGWKAISTQIPSGGQTPANQVNITAVWDDTLPQSTLRWQVDNIAYELRVIGAGGPSQSDLINWANELK